MKDWKFEPTCWGIEARLAWAETGGHGILESVGDASPVDDDPNQPKLVVFETGINVEKAPGARCWFKEAVAFAWNMRLVLINDKLTFSSVLRLRPKDSTQARSSPSKSDFLEGLPLGVAILKASLDKQRRKRRGEMTEKWKRKAHQVFATGVSRANEMLRIWGSLFQ